MDERENLPAKLAAQGLAATAEKRGSLVARGLAAVADRQFRQGMRYRYGEDGTQVDDEKAREYFTDASQLKHAEAQFELATLCGENGEWDESVEWLECSAHLGFGPAQYQYATNFELPEEEYSVWIEKALAWYKTQAEAGNKVWQYEYAMLLLRFDEAIGRCVDIKEGLRWLTASAEQSYRQACRRLASKFLEFLPTAKNVQEAIRWLEQAADLGDTGACVDLAELYLHGNRRVSKFDHREPPTKLVEIDLQAAVYWFERGIQLGSNYAACKLGELYLYGDYLPQNLELAETWLLQAANAGHDSSKLVLGQEYASGVRFRQDADAAIHWLELATENLKSTGLKLAEIYLDGKITPRNFDKAIKWLTLATEGGFRNKAMKLAAEKCTDGKFSVTEVFATQVWLEHMAAATLQAVNDTGNPLAAHNAYHLGELYELGLGVEQSMGKAIHWYRQSAEQDLFIAKKRLDELGIDWKK